MRSKKIILILISLIMITACSSSGDKVVTNKNEPVATANPEEANGENPEEMKPMPVEPWEVSEIGVGLVEVGMTVQEASQILGVDFAAEGSTDSCHYIKPVDGPAGISLMIIDGRVARVDVEDQSIPTSVGAHVGDSEDRIKMLYMNQVEVTPHKYTDGHYLTVVPSNGSNRIVFETDGTKVTRYRAGKMPEVEWVEGCS